MKNLTTITKPTQKCTSCKRIGYYCWTPMGADFETCPLCGKYFSEEHNITNEKLDLNYCIDCHVMSEVGCMHAAGGCTDNDYIGHVVCKWRDKTTNITYDGMPYFESEKEWLNRIDDIEVLDMVCLSTEDEQHCTGSLCCYPKSKYPQYYHKCKYINKENPYLQ